MQKIVPFLWFDTEAEEAAEFYTSLFGGRVVDVRHYGDAGPREAGSVMTVTFEVRGLQLTALNGGPQLRFNEAVSLSVPCETQDEVDELWARLLSEGGEEGQCGWIKDRYGLWWQIVPNALGEMLQDEDRDRARRVMEAMLQMRKIDTAALRRAYDAA